MEPKTGKTEVASGRQHQSRLCQFKPDPGRVRKFDIYCRAYRVTYQILALISLFCIVAAVSAFTARHWIAAGIITVVTALPLSLLFLYWRLMRRKTYEKGLLIPGMIASLQPLTLIALADMRSEETLYNTPQWGCKKIEPGNLPLHTLQVGEKVPCIAVFDVTDSDLRSNFEPRPVSWATADHHNIDQAVRLIDPEEWILLYEVIDREMAVSQTEVTLLCDESSDMRAFG
ncbi:DUF3239 domain-containing protein [Taibaiella chishuiensis]|uniref:Uncharacterized protein DUF3239 n=1 Tax=Taibaiella chishuiensis TaxID=1434707 RepID=A0A2P8D5F4_9BACT|nr:DUF3239 domain-containing protein [Taibaiella chishuiensis]PSK92429.1 uncharacterized protein DUF3239 [Taibaiella chishuiensis]